ncbi:MAG: C39 family peptidase [Paludibacteraceae bacterium]|nr:C39 family peptidase [Paludibacteraceae bacterium]
MEYFVHLFVGNEFSDVVSSALFQIVRMGGKAYSHSNKIYVLNESRVIQHQIKLGTDVDIAKGKYTEDVSEIGEWNLDDIEGAQKFFIDEIYNKNLTATSDTSTLRVMIHFPLYKSEAYTKAMAICDILLKSVECDAPFNFVGYCDDMVKVLEPSYEIVSPASNQMALYVEDRKKREFKVSNHFIAIQNTNQRGVTLALSKDSLAKILSTFMVLCCDNYSSLFPTNVLYRDVLAIGISKLSLDKYIFAEFLFEKMFINAIDETNAFNESINVEEAYRCAERILSDKRTLLSSIFSSIDQTRGVEDNFDKYREGLLQEIKGIIAKCKEEAEYHKNNITFRAAILAAMLSETECELFSNTIFNNGIVDLFDLYNEPLDFYVQNNKENFYKIQEEPIVNPLAELKDVTGKLINAQTQARIYEKRLEELKTKIESAKKVEECYVEDGVFHYQHHRFRLLPDIQQEPLAETYEAHDVSVASVDLHEYFNNVKNQGEQGSCLAHAIVSIFEYAMKRNKQEEVDLSEAFLYYNARMMDASKAVSTEFDSGSKFKPTMDSLTQYGIALEKYCPYDERNSHQKPSDEAYADAATRKLLKAMNVNSSINDIKSALVDGYPVAVSFSLKKSFFEASNGDIPMPTEEEFSDDEHRNKHSNHAMVIVGYSDELHRFILRNSWGTDWGKQGYCYVPYEYVEDNRLCNYCCIITEIEKLEMSTLQQMPSLKINENDMYIQYLVTNGALKKETKEIETLLDRKTLLKSYLEDLKILLRNPNQRDAFIESSNSVLEKTIVQKEQEKKEIESDIEILFEKQRKYNFKFIFSLASGVILFTLLYFTIKYFVNHMPILPYVMVLAVVSIAAFVIYHKKWEEWKELVDEKSKEKEKIEKEVKALEKEKKDFKIKTFCAWEVIQDLEEILSKIQAMYINIISLINNLRFWYKETVQKLDEIKKQSDVIPEISLVDYDTLNDFFESNIKGRSEYNIDFCDDLENHAINSEYLKNYKENLETRLMEKLFTMPAIDSFNFSDCIFENNRNSIAKAVDKEMLDKAYNMSDVFLQVNSTERGSIEPTTFIFMPSLSTNQTKLGRNLERYMAQLKEGYQKYQMVFFRMVSLKIQECVCLRQTHKR